MASFDWPFKYHWPIILHDTFFHLAVPAPLSIWQKPRGMKRSLERRKKGKWLSSLSSNTVSGTLPLLIIMKQIQEKKEEIWLSPMTTWQHKNATKNFYYTTISDRLRTVSWSNNSYPTGVVKPVYRIPTFPSTWLKQIIRPKFPNTIFLRQRLSWSASFSSSFDFCSTF